MTVSYLQSVNGITVVLGCTPYSVPRTHPKWDEILAALHAGADVKSLITLEADAKPPLALGQVWVTRGCERVTIERAQENETFPWIVGRRNGNTYEVNAEGFFWSPDARSHLDLVSLDE